MCRQREETEEELPCAMNTHDIDLLTHSHKHCRQGEQGKDNHVTWRQTHVTDVVNSLTFTISH